MSGPNVNGVMAPVIFLEGDNISCSQFSVVPEFRGKILLTDSLYCVSSIAFFCQLNGCLATAIASDVEVLFYMHNLKKRKKKKA